MFTKFCNFSPGRTHLPHHHGIGASMGDSAGSRSAFHLGLASRHGATLRCVVQDRRSSHGDPTRGSSSAPIPTKKPHIYSAEEIKKILLQTAQLDSPKGLRAHTFTTLFGLLAVSGMRVNEAVNLDRGMWTYCKAFSPSVGRSLASRAMCPSIHRP